MRQIDIKKAEKWPDRGNSHYHQMPAHIDERCPHEGCGKPLFGIKLNWRMHTTSAIAEVECIGCEKPVTYCMVNVAKSDEVPEECGTVIYQYP